MDLVRLGDVPEWVGALAAAGGLAWQAIGRHQRAQALDFIDLVQRTAQVDGDGLAEAIHGNARVAEVFNRLWTAAAASASHDKRQLLARIATDALRGHKDDTMLDDLMVLADTTEAVQPYHVGLLATMARPRPGRGQMSGHLITGTWSLAELQEAHAKAGPMLVPLLRALETLALVENVGTGTYDNQPSWSVTEYGQRLLRFLPEER